MFKALDEFIDRVTMYRLTEYYLFGLLAAAVGLSTFGDLHYKPQYILISTATLLVACVTLNKVFAYVFRAPLNPESSVITALILALILPPNPNPTTYGMALLLAAAGLAIASKYVITIKRSHIFNPAAIAVVLMAVGPKQTASWWVGTAVLLPFVLIGGVILIRKLRRFTMLFSFLISTTIATALFAALTNSNVMTSLHVMVVSSSIFFLGFVMLTEPSSSPRSLKNQVWYAAIVGLLLPPQVHILSLYTSPEIALCIGNIFAYVVSPKVKLFPEFKQKLLVAANCFDFTFKLDQPISYEPGQYMEWTLPHQKTDSRGDRRYLTLASSPTESEIRVGIKFYNNGSSFKKALLQANTNTKIAAAQLAGDFTLPKDKNAKLVFIAGGIGITPFRSMVKYLVDTNQQRDIILLYATSNLSDEAYKPLFDTASESISLKTFYIISENDPNVTPTSVLLKGMIDAVLIKEHVPDYADRTFYLSGTHQMVENVRGSLRELGVSNRNVKTDFFPGYV